MGITGNAGCGKSTVAHMFQSWGARVIDADRIGHELLREPTVRDRVVALCGGGVLDVQGEIDRHKLGRLVFTREDKLAQLNELLHPLIGRRVQEEINAHPEPLIVVEAALLLEAGWEHVVDRIVTVWCSPPVQEARLRDQCGYTEERIQGVRAVQMSQEEKRRNADFSIRNDGSKTELRIRARDVFAHLMLS